MTMKVNIDTDECYIIHCNGFRYTVSYSGGDGYTRFIGQAIEWQNARKLIREDIRQRPHNNSLPLLSVSDHGNISRARRVTLKSVKEGALR